MTMLKNLEILIRPAELTHASKQLILQRRNAELSKKFGSGRRVRRLRAGDQSARSNLNVIGWCHTYC